MYIAPNSTVQLMTNIPLEESYTHTLYWASQAQMETYMSAHVLQSFNSQSYVHKARGVLRLEADMGVFSTVNYMRFKNTSFENKWFYAFVTDINYVNNEVIEVNFKIDVMQTFFFDYNGKLNQCMVLREHSATDAVGDNIVDEGLEYGDYVQAGLEFVASPPAANPWKFLVIATQSPAGGQNSMIRDNIGGSLYVYPCNSAEELENVLNLYLEGVTSSLEPIIGINQFPSNFVNDSGIAAPFLYRLTNDQAIGLGPFRCYDPTSMTYDTYTPVNNKLYCYPYNFMTFESPDGSTVFLRYEKFKNHNVHTFRLYAATYPSVQSQCMPLDYEADNGSLVSSLYASNYPTCGVASDAFAAWWAQNKNSLQTGQVIDIVTTGWGAVKGAARSALSGDFAGALGDLGFGALDTLGAKYITDAEISAKQLDHKAVPDTVVTKAAGGGVLWGQNLYQYKVYYTKIHPDYARMIDSYFTRYGYAVKAIKTPAIANRPVWNYIQTNGCTLNRTANVPTAFEHEICACFDRGITFWKDAGQVGHYTADNSPQ